MHAKSREPVHLLPWQRLLLQGQPRCQTPSVVAVKHQRLGQPGRPLWSSGAAAQAR